MPVKRRTSEAGKRGGGETGPVAEAFARHSIAAPSREARKGKRRVEVSAVAVGEGDRPLFRHVMVPHRDAPSPRAVSIALTPRQQQVLRLLADGVPARLIAERLGLAEATVRNHIRAILAAFEAHSQLEAIAKAVACSSSRSPPASPFRRFRAPVSGGEARATPEWPA